MGWRECSIMDEKLKFIARYLEGEKMAPLCREFGITSLKATITRDLLGRSFLSCFEYFESGLNFFEVFPSNC
jgi:uncharacterized protein (DUF1810 family)